MTKKEKVDDWSIAIDKVSTDGINSPPKGYNTVYQQYLRQNSHIEGSTFSLKNDDQNLAMVETIVLKVAFENGWNVNKLLRTIGEVRLKF